MTVRPWRQRRKTIGNMLSQKLRRALIVGAMCVAPAACFLLPSPHASDRASASTEIRLRLSEERDRGRRSSPDRPRRPPPNRSAASPRPRSRNDLPAAARTQNGKRRRAPHQFDHTKADARPFLDDPVAYVSGQSPNEDAPCYVFPGDDVDASRKLTIPEGSHIVSFGLDELFPGLDFSDKFCLTGEFRDALRSAMREDIFDSTPSYAGMSEKARRMLLLPDSSLQGSWKCCQPTRKADDNNDGDDKLRMVKLTRVLKEYLGEGAPTGDAFMETIGSLCGSSPSTHWIDIVGITDRKIPHSWHQDTGRSPGGDTRTVLLGFPKEDGYDGVGVFSHVVKLRYERAAPEDHPSNEPVVYPELTVGEEYVVRPRFVMGTEIIAFRDIDSVHSAPDVAYRASVMRFM